MKTKKLFIFDLDNTLTDSAGLTAAASREAAAFMARALNMPLADMYGIIRRSPDQFRFSDYGRVARWLDQEGHLPPAKTPSERMERDTLIRAIDAQWKKAQRESTMLYDGVLDVLRAIKAQGASIVIYTDAEAAPMMQRLHHLAVHAASIYPGMAGPDDLLDLFDHFYCQPGLEPDGEFLAGCDAGFIRAVKEKTTLWRDRAFKPDTGHMRIILDDYRTPAAEAVMVGDSYKDGGCAIPLGIDFVWFYPGTVFTDDHVQALLSISDPGWNYGTAAITERFNETNSPTHTVRADFAEIVGFFDIAPGNAFRNSDCTAPGSDGYCRNCACHADETRPAKRLKPLFPLQSPPSPLGPASHVPRATPAPAARDSSGTADPGKTATPPAPPPAPTPAS